MFKPIRKRGYFRALKRGEPWALMREAEKEMLNSLIKQFIQAEKDWKKAG